MVIPTLVFASDSRDLEERAALNSEEYQFDGFRFDGVTSMLCLVQMSLNSIPLNVSLLRIVVHLFPVSHSPLFFVVVGVVIYEATLRIHLLTASNHI